MASLQEVQRWLGFRVDDVYGTRIGRLVGVYCDRDTEHPVWMMVRTSRAFEIYHAVPLQRVAVGNERIWIPLTKAQVVSSARLPLARPVAPALEAKLCRHYGVPLTHGARLARGDRRSTLFVIGLPGDPGASRAMAATEPRTEQERRRRTRGTAVGRVA